MKHHPGDFRLDRATAAGPARRLLEPIHNELLAALPPADLERLRPRLERVVLRRGQVLQERNVPLSHAYFIETGTASLTARAGGGAAALEVGMLGCRDTTGAPLVLGTGRSPHRCVVQAPGYAYRIGAEALRRAMGECARLRDLLLGYVQAAMVQGAQIAACNAHHTLSQRLARWLLVASDRIDGREIASTHLSLSRALGVRRAGITTTMGEMERAGLLRRGRGRVVVLDCSGLETVACDCYRTIRAEQNRTFLARPANDVGAPPWGASMVAEPPGDETPPRPAPADPDERIRDLHHRVKNGLQMIAGLLHLEAKDAGPGEAAVRLQDAQRRLLILAHLHERLYARDASQGGLVDAGPELQALCSDLAASTGAEERRVTIAVAAERCPLGIDRLTPLALIAAEAVINAVKHAAPTAATDRWTTVRVGLRHDAAARQAVLSVRDDGPGISPETVSTGTGLGGRLLAAFVRQLDGTLEERSGGDRAGAALVVTFPMDAAP